MEKFMITVTNVTVFADSTPASVKIEFEETIPGYTRNEQDEPVKTDVTSISMARSALTSQLCEVCDDIADYRACRTTAFDQKALSLILRRASLLIEREEHAAGEEIPDKQDADGNPIVFQHDCFTTKILKVKLTERAQEKLDKALNLD